jgi:predicted ATP-dependent protease
MLDRFQGARTRLLKEMDSVAGGQGFNLDVDDRGSLTLYPLVEGKRLSEDEFGKLDGNLRYSLKRKGDALLQTMTGLVRKLSQAERQMKSHEKGLEREVVEEALDVYLSPVAERACRNAARKGGPEDGEVLSAFFERLREDILDHADSFLPRDNPPPGAVPADAGMPVPPEPDVYRYDVNLFVDNSRTRGAPIIADEHPTFTNLLGCVEREAEMGALVTDFSLIKAGSLHKANGGYLVLHIADLLQQPGAWEGLVRALRAGLARVEDPADGQENARTKGIEPEALPLRLKVVLVGAESLYENLLLHDDRFSKLFKIKAQMAPDTWRNAAGVHAWLFSLARMIDEAGLLPFHRDALAGLVDFGSWLCEDQRKLSLKFPLVREVMIEASALASANGAGLVDRAVLDKALAGRLYRANLVEESFMEEYDRDLIKIGTAGSGTGLVNGLSVSWSGDFEFGLPHQISCTVGVGHGGIIDLEREAELGGPIHTKAMLILKSYLVDQFAHSKPLVLTGSLCFEQNYYGIEGDSASGAELAALLSAISRVPVRLSLAFTGAVSQSGHILAVGSVSRKIEGFFRLCSRRGLTGEQGVIIPRDNIEHLLLDAAVMEAVRGGKFSIYPVAHISQALELLTGLPAGKRRKDGSFPKGSLFSLVDARLHELGWLAEHSFKTRKRKKTDSAPE